jgi:O-antigen ligase
MLLYQSHSPNEHYREAHNDYLQLAAEGGLLVGIPILILVALFVREVRRRFLDQADDARTYWTRVGAVTGLLAVACQDVVEFSLQLPGNAVLFCVLAAIAVHPCRLRAKSRSTPPTSR